MDNLELLPTEDGQMQHEMQPADVPEDITENPAQSEDATQEDFDPINNPAHRQYIEMWASQLGMAPQEQPQQVQPDPMDEYMDPGEKALAMIQAMQEQQAQAQAQFAQYQAVQQAQGFIAQSKGQEAGAAVGELFSGAPELAQAYLARNPFAVKVVDTFILGSQKNGVAAQLQGQQKGVPTPIQAQTAAGETPGAEDIAMARELFGEDVTPEMVQRVMKQRQSYKNG